MKLADKALDAMAQALFDGEGHEPHHPSLWPKMPTKVRDGWRKSVLSALQAAETHGCALVRTTATPGMVKATIGMKTCREMLEAGIAAGRVSQNAEIARAYGDQPAEALAVDGKHDCACAGSTLPAGASCLLRPEESVKPGSVESVNDS